MTTQELDFSIKKDIKKVNEASEPEQKDLPVSMGFWYSIDEGDYDMFVNLLENEETKIECRHAIRVLNKLEKAIDDYVIWA